MESMATILTSSNLIPLAVIAVVLICLLAYLSRMGIFSFNGKGLKVGGDETERKIVRQQLEYTDITLDATYSDLPKELQNDHALVVISKVKDQFERMIVFNHITDDDEYISLKKDVVYSTVVKWTTDDYFKTDEFRKYIYELTEKIIKRFVKIRKTYS